MREAIPEADLSVLRIHYRPVYIAILPFFSCAWLASLWSLLVAGWPVALRTAILVGGVLSIRAFCFGCSKLLLARLVLAALIRSCQLFLDTWIVFRQNTCTRCKNCIGSAPLQVRCGESRE